MVEAERVVSYEDMLNVIMQPEKVIIDVRNPDEIIATGKIPSSINVPPYFRRSDTNVIIMDWRRLAMMDYVTAMRVPNVQHALGSMSDEDFHKQFNRKKPSAKDEIIFYCRSGNRATQALNQALDLGYSRSKNYLGSWEEWSNRQR